VEEDRTRKKRGRANEKALSSYPFAGFFRSNRFPRPKPKESWRKDGRCRPPAASICVSSAQYFAFVLFSSLSLHTLSTISFETNGKPSYAPTFLSFAWKRKRRKLLRAESREKGGRSKRISGTKYTEFDRVNLPIGCCRCRRVIDVRYRSFFLPAK
jgi:hypothetical protein